MSISEERAGGAPGGSAIDWFDLQGSPEPGTPLIVTIDGVDVAVAALGDRFVAFDDTCTHRQCPLSEGEIDDVSVTCPCHKSRFDLGTGEPLNGPATERLRVRSVRADGGRLQVER